MTAFGTLNYLSLFSFEITKLLGSVSNKCTDFHLSLWNAKSCVSSIMFTLCPKLIINVVSLLQANSCRYWYANKSRRYYWAMIIKESCSLKCILMMLASANNVSRVPFSTSLMSSIELISFKSRILESFILGGNFREVWNFSNEVRYPINLSKVLNLSIENPNEANAF